MIMTGISGKNKNSEKIIVLFDSSIKIDEIKKIQSDYDDVQIIIIDSLSNKILKKNNITCVPFDDYISNDEKLNIQKTSYLLSDWYLEKSLANIMKYHNVNLGSLLKSELINILVNFLKNFYTVYKITQKHNLEKFFCSKKFEPFFKNFSKNVIILESENSYETLPLDTLETNINVGLKNLNLKIGVNRLNQLKNLAEKFSNIVLKPKINVDSNFFLFSELNTKRFSKLFKKMPDFPENYVIYNRRQPSIWDKESLSILKNSKSILENSNSLDSIKNQSSTSRISDIQEIIKNLKIQENILCKLFVIENMSFWTLFKNIFFTLIEKRFETYSYEIILVENLLNKYDFKGILLQNEVGPNEQILIQLGKNQKIPIHLMQHGLIFDTNDALQMNKHQGVMGYDVDYQLVWGKIDYDYRKSQGFDTEKIIKIGSPIYDGFLNLNTPNRDYILLATSGPTEEDIFDLTLDTINKNIQTIKKISKIVSSMNHDLIIKTHPSPDEFDPTKILEKINPNIQIIKSGNISNLIKNCSLMIVIDFSSVILDSHLMKKPVISISVKNNGYGSPTAFSNASCITSNVENLENNIRIILEKKYSEQVQNGLNSATDYITNIGCSSEKLLSFLAQNPN
tara:strand:+ start:13552 stop:15426 length:1875 start_codon:yes stop_codon:yes gene_type:complete